MIYKLRAWQRLRSMVLANEPLCRDCHSRGIITLATEVDHIVPMSKGGDAWDTDNLQPLCKPCHSSKTSVDAGRSPVLKGATTTGEPIDPNHPWHR